MSGLKETMLYLTRDELGDGTIIPGVDIWRSRPSRHEILDPMGTGYGWDCGDLDGYELKDYVTKMDEREAKARYADIPTDSKALVIVWTSAGVTLTMRGDN